MLSCWGQNVDTFKSSTLVVQIWKNPRKTPKKCAYSGILCLYQILPWQTNKIFIIGSYSNLFSTRNNSISQVGSYFTMFFFVVVVLIPFTSSPYRTKNHPVGKRCAFNIEAEKTAFYTPYY